MAQTSGKTKSEIVRDALRRHIERERFGALQRVARDRAEALGVGPEDVEGLVDEVRAARA